MAFYLFSDAHLGAGSPETDSPGSDANKVERIGRLCDLVKADGDRLAILGDLFDFWFEYKHAIPKDHHDVLFMLRDLVKRGVRIDYISGNHDFWMGNYFERQLGLHLHRDSYDTEYEGKRIHLIHGDGLATGDRGYRLLKRILRNPLNIWLYRKLPPDWAIPLAKKVSQQSRLHAGEPNISFIGDYEEYARKKLCNGFDIVAMAHTHTPLCKQIEGGIYVNTGDFIKHFSYVRIDSGDVRLEHLR